MSLSYNAAEYFLQVILNSPDFCITYDSLKNQVKQANQDLAAYFNLESKYNLIFSKFPEIFTYNNGLIGLTDAFLTLYTQKKLSTVLPSDLSSDMKKSAILYFLKILIVYGPQQYFSLCNMLINDKTQKCAQYFNYCTVSDVFNFFASNPQYFIINNGIVAATPSCADEFYKKEKKAIRKLNKYVCFLLECFETLHYFELRECIIYADNVCHDFLKQFSLIKHREYFENIPNTVIDKYGFLSLKDKSVSPSPSKKQKMKLLIVCILAYKKEMHFEDLISEAIEKYKPSVVYFQNMCTEDKLKFLKKTLSKLVISKGFFVKLSPTITLPKCSFKDLSPPIENTKQDSYTEKQCNTVASVNSDLNNIKVNSPNQTLFSYQNEIESNDSSVDSDRNNIKVNSQSQKLITSQNHITLNEKYTEKEKPAQRILNDRVRFLLKCFETLHYFQLKECISYQEIYCKKFFEQLSVTQLYEYFESIPNTVMDENGFLCLEGNVPSPTTIFSTELKMKLIIVCILAFKKKINFNDLMNEFIERSKLSEHYFQSMSMYLRKFLMKFPSSFIISEDGFVKLLPTFSLPECCFKGIPSSCKNSMLVENTKVQYNTGSSVYKELSEIRSSNPISITSQDQFITSGKHNKKPQVVPNMPIINKYLLCISPLPKTINERIRISVFYVLKHFYSLDYKCILKTLLHTLDDVRLTFASLSESEKQNFILVVSNFMKTIPPIEIDCGTEVFEITNKENFLLIVSYMLIHKKKMHFEEIISVLKSKNILDCLSACAKSYQLQYFRTFSGYINIGNDGYVSLAQTFNPVMTIIDSYSYLFFKHKFTSECNAFLENNEGIPSHEKTASLRNIDEISDVFESKQKVKVYDDEAVAKKSCDYLPDNFWQSLSYSSYFLRNIFKSNIITEHLLVASLICLDVLNYFYDLSSSSQTIFVKKYFKFISKEVKNPLTSPISKDKEIILCITYLLLEQKMLHYEKIFKELKKFNINIELCGNKGKAKFHYFRIQEKYFEIRGNGCVTLKSTIEPVISVINSAFSCTEEVKRPIINQSSLSASICKLPLESDVLVTSLPNAITKSFSNNQHLSNSKSSAQVTQIDLLTKNTIIDMCFHLLSVCEKMTVEELCYRLKSCNIEKIQNLFKNFTSNEKLAFFQNISQYFYVSKDGFVCLKSGVIETYVPKTNITFSQLLHDYSGKSLVTSQGRTESVKSDNSSESLSVSSSISSSQKEQKTKHIWEKQTLENANKIKNATEDPLKVKSRNIPKRSLDKSKSKSISNISSNGSNSGYISNSPLDRNSSNSVSNISFRNSGSDFAYNSSEFLQSDYSVNPSISMETIQNFSTSNDDFYQAKEVNIISEKVDTTVPEILSETERSYNEKTSDNHNSSFLVGEILIEVNTQNQFLSNCQNKLAIEKKSDESTFLMRNPVSLNKNVNNKIEVTDKPSSIASIIEKKAKHKLVSVSEGENKVKIPRQPFHVASSFQQQSKELTEDASLLDISSVPIYKFKCDTPHKAYISQFIDSYQVSMPLESSKASKSLTTKSMTENFDEECNKLPNHLPQNALDCNKNNNCISKDVQNSINNEKSTSNCDSGSKLLLNERAVNFFCVILENYGRYYNGFSERFLKQQLRRASSEVQSFILENYKDDFLSFFQTYNEVFYVSVQSHLVYMLKNPL